MSDTGRQSLTDKAGSAMKPDSQKSTTEQVGDYAKGTMDSAASTLQPNSEKSAGQKAGDSVSGNSNENQDSLLGKAKNAMGMGEKMYLPFAITSL
ncbi:heat shock protein 9/12-domain-containing protein [Collybia nuda]|uniref:Heat shock protein 9/12-domain-containing protein n=1 Tax=Collybia nuda TaxID=64659 RepID=A0A9P5YJY1_9AGAR|nr:heat shock protein 9/12-domain-containing protein [Collybia nuda]